MIKSVVYQDGSQLASQESTFDPSTSPLFHITIAKILVIVLIYLLGDLLSDTAAAYCVTVAGALEFWITKNMGRKYLQASWSVDTSGEEDVWVFEANFKKPSAFE